MRYIPKRHILNEYVVLIIRQMANHDEVILGITLMYLQVVNRFHHFELKKRLKGYPLQHCTSDLEGTYGILSVDVHF